MEDIIEGIFGGLLRLLSFIFRLLFNLFWEIIPEFILWPTGWCFLRLISFGRYPKEGFWEEHKASVLTTIFVNLVGIALLFPLFVFVILKVIF